MTTDNRGADTPSDDTAAFRAGVDHVLKTEGEPVGPVTFDPNARRLTDDQIGEKIGVLVGAFLDANTPYQDFFFGLQAEKTPELVAQQDARRAAHESRQAEARARLGKAFRELMAEVLRDARVFRFEFATNDVKPEQQR